MKITACPACKGNNSIQVVYGFPTPELSRRADAGEVVLAACPDWSDGPDRKCLDCGKRFFSNSTAQQAYDDETAHQVARLAAMKRGDYMFFDPRSQSAEEIADAINVKYAETTATNKSDSKKAPKSKRRRKR